MTDNLLFVLISAIPMLIVGIVLADKIFGGSEDEWE